jgi:hypothetical protein
MKTLLICLSLTLVSVHSISQNIENLRTVIQGSKAIVTYDLIGVGSYYIEIYSSIDTFTNQIRFAIGDLGSGIKPGKGKKIVINLELEKITLYDNLKFQINTINEDQGQEVVSDNSLNSIVFNVKDLGRGKTNEIYWPATNTSIFVNIELHHNGKLVYPLASNTPNSGFFSWKTLKSLNVDGNYQIIIVDVNNSLNLVKSNMFMIKPQIPTIVKVLAGIGAAAIIGGVIYGIYYY